MIVFWPSAIWEHYLYWQQTDKQILKRINSLIKDISRSSFKGIDNPEVLKHNWTGFWSRRIDREHRLTYTYSSNEIIIA